jgi:hypothetical protein
MLLIKNFQEEGQFCHPSLFAKKSTRPFFSPFLLIALTLGARATALLRTFFISIPPCPVE